MAGLAAKRERIARARAQLDAARVPYRRAESRLIRLQRDGAPAAQIDAARQALLRTVPGVAAAQELLAEARAPRASRRAGATPGEPSNHRRAG